MKKTITIILALFCYSCQKKQEKVEIDVPLSVAEKTVSLKNSVLKEMHSENSFQIESAKIFLDNLKFQKSLNGERYKLWSRLINEHSNKTDSLLMEIGIRKNNFSPDVESYDILAVKKENIVSNLLLTYKTYQKSKWQNEISLDTYCQYLLPYKIGKEPFVPECRNYLLNQFLKEKGDSIYSANLVSAAKQVHKWLYSKKYKFKILGNEEQANIPEMSADILDKLNFGTCHQLTVEGVSYMRALGIPASIDFAPTYLNINAGHEWGSVILDSTHCLPFDITSKKINNIKKQYFYFSKVYRRTYLPVKESHFMQRGESIALPALFNNPFIKDVTKLYTKTANFQIPVPKNVTSKFCYICVFNRRSMSWDPVGWGKIENGKASFNDVGVNGVYLSVVEESNKLAIVNSPFILDKEGKTKFLISNPSETETVRLFRKVNSNVFKDVQKSRMVDGVFQGSNSIDFKNPVNFYTIKKNPGDYFNTVQIEKKGNNGVRYVRYYSAKDSYGNVAEIEFYQSDSASPLRGKIIGTEGSYLDDPKCTKEAVFDGNLLSYFDSKFADHSWAGLDLGVKKEISKIRFIARNDMNCIQIGNIYELFYWNNGWKTLGKKTAKSTFLDYNNVPKKSLLWLRNLTEGNEERIFTYENKKQVWW